MPIARIGQDFIVNTTTTDDQTNPSITALADGRFVMTWTSKDPGDGSQGCIRARIYNANGSPAGSDFIVNSTVTGNQQHPSITALPDGRFVVTWESFDPGDGSGSCIRARLYNADGSAAGADFVVNSTGLDTQYSPAVTALSDGRFVVTWDSYDGLEDGFGTCIRARIFGADGSGIGDDFVVNTTFEGGQLYASVTALVSGRFVVAWHSRDTGDGSWGCVRARIYNADGSPRGGDFIVNTSTLADQSFPSITALSNGRWVATWQSYDTGDGSGTCIRGRVFNANGTAAGTDFIVNTTAESTQTSPSVTELADGRFVVTWHSYDTGDGSGSCVRSRLFSADGTALGEDFIVNTTTQSNQDAPSVAALADGRFVISWRSHDSGDGSGTCIRAQIFDPTTFYGTAGDDVWEGGSLADRIYGGAGNDILYGHGGNDIIYGGAGDDKLYGGAGDDHLFGDAGNDWLDGGAGVDWMYGGMGDDTYVVRNSDDKVYETANQGYDVVRATVDYALATVTHVEELRTDSNAGTKAINLTGNSFDQKIVGNAGDNVIDGGGGKNVLTGGAGRDTFVFSTKIGAARTDTITDFKAADDTLQLSSAIFKGLAMGQLKASAFKDIAKGTVDASDRILYDSSTGALYFDRDGSGDAYQPVQFAILENKAAISAADFFVV